MYLTTNNFGNLICNWLVGWYQCFDLLNAASCQETSRHIWNAYDLENGIGGYGAFQGIETCSCGKINAFDKIVIGNGVIGMIVIGMSHGNEISSSSNFCGINCGNGFFGNDVSHDDYHCCCGEGCGCDDVRNPSNPAKWSEPVEGWMHQEQAETGLRSNWLGAETAEKMVQWPCLLGLKPSVLVCPSWDW